MIPLALGWLLLMAALSIEPWYVIVGFGALVVAAAMVLRAIAVGREGALSRDKVSN
jgi:hypothetical protein